MGDDKLHILKYLAKKGGDIYGDDEESALLDDANTGAIKTVKFLIQKKADIQADDDFALRIASRKGFLPIVRFLVKNGANVNHKYIDTSALTWAIEYNKPKIVKFLIENGAIIYNEHIELSKGRRNIYRYLTSIL